MTTPRYEYLLFPHSILPEADYRLLTLALPRLGVLQVITGTDFPAWAEDRLYNRPTLEDTEYLDFLRRALGGYRKYAEEYGSDGLRTLMSRGIGVEDVAETRFRIQSTLRGKKAEEVPPSEICRFGAAVFLELARELDEREIDLQEGLNRFGRMEDELQNIIAGGTREELEEAVEVADLRLRYDRSHFAFLMKQRMGAWFRLLAEHPPEVPPVLVAPDRDGAEELLDPVYARKEKERPDWTPVSVEAMTLPGMELPDADKFEELLGDLEECGMQAVYFDSLETMLDDPAETERQEAMQTAALETASRVQNKLEEKGLPIPVKVKVKFLYAPDVKLAEAWKLVDQEGYEALGADFPDYPLRLMHLQE
jgi:hypothetical protein